MIFIKLYTTIDTKTRSPKTLRIDRPTFANILIAQSINCVLSNKLFTSSANADIVV